METSANNRQVDGTHYTDMLIQPWQIGYAIANGDSGFVKLAKYLTRIKDNPTQQFQKAEHVCQLRGETDIPPCWTVPLSYQQRVLLEAFCKQFPEAGTLLAALGLYLAGEFSEAAKTVIVYKELVIHAMDKRA